MGKFFESFAKGFNQRSWQSTLAAMGIGLTLTLGSALGLEKYLGENRFYAHPLEKLLAADLDFNTYSSKKLYDLLQAKDPVFTVLYVTGSSGHSALADTDGEMQQRLRQKLGKPVRFVSLPVTKRTVRDYDVIIDQLPTGWNGLLVLSISPVTLTHVRDCSENDPHAEYPCDYILGNSMPFDSPTLRQTLKPLWPWQSWLSQSALIRYRPVLRSFLTNRFALQIQSNGKTPPLPRMPYDRCFPDIDKYFIDKLNHPPIALDATYYRSNAQFGDRFLRPALESARQKKIKVALAEDLRDVAFAKQAWSSFAGLYEKDIQKYKSEFGIGYFNPNKLEALKRTDFADPWHVCTRARDRILPKLVDAIGEQINAVL